MSRAPSETCLRTSVLLGLLLTTMHLAPAAAITQETTSTPVPPRLQGVVILESTFQPIEAATVSVVGTEIKTLTGRLGDFAIPDAPLGTVWVRVTAPGLPSIREQVQISGDGVVYLQFRVPEDVSAVLDAVLVEGWDDEYEYTGTAQTALDLLAIKVPGIRHRSGNVGLNGGSVQLRGLSSLTQSGDPLLVIDNVVARGAAPRDVLSLIPAADVAEIEVLRGPTAAFLYPYAANGVIRVTTKKR